MDHSFASLDWSLVQTFLSVAETGSLSEAARQLGVSQPTVGRQVQKIEESLGVTLFHRQARGFALTSCGASLMPHARAMAEAVQGFSIAAAGHDHTLSGTVRITASVFTAHHHLPPIIARIRALEPDIQVELVPTDTSENLLYREADIAVRMYRTEQLDIVTKHLGELEIGLYAATTYLDRRGRPTAFSEIFDHDLVGYDRSDLILRGLREGGIEAQRDWFATRTDHHGTYWELVRAGCGIGFAQTSVADKDPLVERLIPDMPLPTLPLWLAAHDSIRRTPRVRRVWDLLEEGLLPFVS